MAKSGTISTKLVVENASKYNSDLKIIKSNLTELRSELKTCSEQFKGSENSVDALTKKEQILNKSYEEAKKQVALYSAAIKESTPQLEKYKTAHDEAAKKYQEASEKLKALEAAGKENTKEYAEQQAAVAQLKTEMEKANSEYTFAVTEMNKYQTALNNATAEELNYNNQLQETRGYLDEAKNSTDGCAHSIDEFGNEIKETKEETHTLDERLDELVKNEALQKLNEAAKEVLNTFKECAKAAETFDYSMAKVQSIAQVNGDEFNNLSTEIRRVATEMGYSSNEIAEATYQAISASVDAADAVTFVEDATKLARAGFTETTTSVDVLTTALNAYGKEANTTAHIADDLITTQNLGKTTVDELAESIGTIIPTASAYNVSLDQLSSAYVILTRQGINTANSTTYLRGMLNELADSGSDVSDILSQETGHSFGELMKQGYTLGDVMQILGETVDGDSERFANLFGNIRAGQGALAIFNQGADAFNGVLEQMENNAGATNTAFEIMADTAEMTNARFEASVENLKIAVGNSLMPTIDSLKESGIEMMEPITAFIEEHPRLVSALAGASAGLVAATTAATGLAMAVALCKAAFGDLSGLLTVGIVAGVGAATGAYLGLKGTIEETASELDKQYEAMQQVVEGNQKFNESLTTSVQTRQESRDSLEAEGRAAEKLITELENLTAKTELTTSEQLRMQDIVDQLNTAFPELNLAIDDETGKLNMSTDAIRQNVEALNARARAQAAQEDLTAIAKEQYEAEKELYELEKKRNEVIEEDAELTRKAAEEIAEYGRVTDETQEALTVAAESAENYSTQINATKDSLTALNEEYEFTNQYLQENTDLAASAADATSSLGEAQGMSASEAEAFAESQERINDAISEASDAISGQIGLFDEWNSKSELTLAQMQDRWKQQNEGIDQYTDDLAYVKTLIESDTDPAIKNLAQTMVDMGVEGAAELHEFVTGLQELSGNAQGLQELTNTWQEHIDKIQAAEDLYAGIKLQDEGYVEEATELFNRYYEESEIAQSTHNDNTLESAEQLKTDLTDKTTETVESVTQAVTDGTDDVTGAAQAVAQATIDTATSTLGMNGGQSSVFYDMGISIDNSLAAGINDGTSAVVGAIQNLCSEAVANVDISGIVDVIDQTIAAGAQRAGAVYGK